jgi:hypothetical protein
MAIIPGFQIAVTTEVIIEENNIIKGGGNRLPTTAKELFSIMAISNQLSATAKELFVIMEASKF